MIIISFKSNRENFIKELHGIKCNTLRKIDAKDKRFKLIANMNRTKKYETIEITCGDSCFKRKIRDITYWDGYVIISWDNPDLIKDFARKVKDLFDKSRRDTRYHELFDRIDKLVEEYRIEQEKEQWKEN